MYRAANVFILVTVFIFAYSTFAYFTEPRFSGDTIQYKAVSENPMTPVEEVVEDPTVATTSDIVSENVPEESTPPPAPPPPVVDLIEPETVIEVVESDEIVETKDVIPFSDINTMARNAIVNILCTTDGPHQYVTPISGSGTIISDQGVILTNAHIAQLYLFEDFPSENFVDCQIRTGSPAKAAYRATLLYISPSWIEANAEAIITENPKGTGEDDFALLLITESMTNDALPESFPYIPFDTEEQIVARDDALLIGAYPAGFLGSRTIQQDLFASTAIVSVGELYTFDDTLKLDLISLGGSVVAQQGASGGPAVNQYGNMIALISTSSDGDSTADRDLRAVTLEHINRSLLQDNNTTIDELLSGYIQQKATAFNNTAALTLLQILLNNFSL